MEKSIPIECNIKSKVIEAIRKKKNYPINTINKKIIDWNEERYFCNEYEKLGKWMKELFDELQNIYVQFDFAKKLEDEAISWHWLWKTKKGVKLVKKSRKCDKYKEMYSVIHCLIEDIKISKDKIIPIKIEKHVFRFYYNKEEYSMWKYWVVLSDKNVNNEQTDTKISHFVSNSFNKKVIDYVSLKGAISHIKYFKDFPENIYDYRPIEKNYN